MSIAIALYGDWIGDLCLIDFLDMRSPIMGMAIAGCGDG
jgi:hypothetical protein